ncbi:MAG TPA: TolC family protein [Opitutaceae bacterium]|nr:TolC family protein [Opitutaceae bacterium]
MKNYKMGSRFIRLIEFVSICAFCYVSAMIAAETVSYPIDLPTALRLVGAQNLDVRIAQEKLNEAKANQEQAKLMFFPWVNPGVTYHRVDGNTQAVDGTILDVSKQAYTIGGAVTAGVNLGDAYYNELASRQQVAAQAKALEAQKADSVYLAASGYFELSKATALVGVAREAVRISSDYSQQVQHAIDAGIAFKGDFFRVENQMRRNEVLLSQAEEQLRAASARLAQVLKLSPSTVLVAAETEISPIVLVSPQTPLDELLGRAAANRPEVGQASALSESAHTANRGARYAPLIPTLGAQAYFGGLGGGKNGSWGNFENTFDGQVGLSWRIGPGGLFDRSRIRSTGSRARASDLQVEKVREEVARQVVETHSHVQSVAAQLEITHHALSDAAQAFKLSRDRREFGVGIVLETIQSEQDLTRTRSDYVTLLAEQNKAQYALLHALGDRPDK